MIYLVRIFLLFLLLFFIFFNVFIIIIYSLYPSPYFYFCFSLFQFSGLLFISFLRIIFIRNIVFQIFKNLQFFIGIKFGIILIYFIIFLHDAVLKFV